MKKHFVAFWLLLGTLAVNAQSNKTVIKDDNAEARQVDAFTGIEVSSAIVAYVVQGKSTGVAISCEDNEHKDKIITKVTNGVLRIYVQSGGWNFWDWSSKKIKAYISVKDLYSINASGASSVRLTNGINTEHLKVILSGASTVAGEVNASSLLSLDCSGASSAKLSGSTPKLVVDASGASTVKLVDVRATAANVQASGASNVQVNVQKNLKAEASGASSIKYAGNPTNKDCQSSGASSISAKL